MRLFLDLKGYRTFLILTIKITSLFFLLIKNYFFKTKEIQIAHGLVCTYIVFTMCSFVVRHPIPSSLMCEYGHTRVLYSGGLH